MNVEGQGAGSATLINLHGADYKCNIGFQEGLFCDGNGRFSGGVGQELGCERRI